MIFFKSYQSLFLCIGDGHKQLQWSAVVIFIQTLSGLDQLFTISSDQQ